jgi:hypothetical protein
VWQDLYVDELLSGFVTIQETQLLQQGISRPLLVAEFPLLKRSSTSEESLATVPKYLQETQHPL